MGQENSHPEPGDLIEIDRSYHQHWALYLGDGYVINLTPVGKKDAAALGVHSLPEYIRKVEKQLLKEAVGKNKWHINNEADQYCSSLPVEEIIQHAEQSIDMEVTYHVFGSNCERFVQTLRYGDQVLNALKCSHGISAAAGIGLAGVISLATNPFFFAAAGVGLFANIGLMSHTYHHILKCLKFQRSQYDVLEHMCC